MFQSSFLIHLQNAKDVVIDLSIFSAIIGKMYMYITS